MLARGVRLCRKFQPVAEAHGYHVALAGGALLRGGPRKDVDILLYPDLTKNQDLPGLFMGLEGCGVIFVKDYGFARPSTFDGQRIDFMVPTEKATELGEIRLNELRIKTTS